RPTNSFSDVRISQCPSIVCPFRNSVLRARPNSIRSDTAISSCTCQHSFVTHVECAAITEHQSTARTNCTSYIQLEFWFRSAQAQIAFFIQTHLFLRVAGVEVTQSKRKRAATSRDLSISTIVRDHGCCLILFVA